MNERMAVISQGCRREKRRMRNLIRIARPIADFPELPEVAGVERHDASATLQSA
ncbi:MAG TPA: hypothetical protein VJS63_09970 [Bradyrhizobium sp.]|nr:hypothetical protein [Bradyrhizobium sp.]